MIESKVSEEVDNNDYPLIMKNIERDTIIMACPDQDVNSETFAGVVLAGSYFGYSAGEYSSLWVRSNFKPFNGEITLKNK